MPDRHTELSELIAAGVVRLRDAPEVLRQPAPFAGRRIPRDKLRGMLLGLAIGDALGNTTESRLPHERRKRWGEIRHFLPNPHLGDRLVGTPTDDTQLAFWLLEHLLSEGRVEPGKLARKYCTGGRIHGLGTTMRAFLAGYKATGDLWQAAQDSAGNGGIMRIAPVILPHVQTGSAELWVDAVLSHAMTHNSRPGTAASVAFTGLLAELLVRDTPPDPMWWIDTWLARARLLEGEEPSLGPRHAALGGGVRTLWGIVSEEVPPMLDRPSIEACEYWHSGAYMPETMPSVLHVLARHGDDPEEAIVRAVNDTKDNDTVAAIVGAAVGALHGAAALPRRWREGLTGRVVASQPEDGRVQHLIEEALDRWAAAD